MSREPTRYERFHWRLFNVLAKIGGWGFIIVGTIVGASFVPTLLDKKATIDVNGEPTTDVVTKSIAVGLPLLAAVLGFFMVRAKKWYPQDVRDWFEEQDRKKAT